MFGIFVVFTKIYLYDSISRYDKEDKNVKQNEVSAKTGAGYWQCSVVGSDRPDFHHGSDVKISHLCFYIQRAGRYFGNQRAGNPTDF